MKKGEGMQISVEEVTPAEAAVYLTKNDCNRPITESHVRSLAQQMASGHWALNGETLVFAGDGTLLQGQHRCHACVRANVPFRTVVVRGVDKSTFDTLDSGKRRSGRDVLGIARVENATAVAAAARILLNEENGALPSAWMGSFANHEIRSCVERHPGLVGATGSSLTPAKLLGIGGGTLGWFYYRIKSSEGTCADDFMGKLSTGEMLDKSNPIFLLRRRMIEEKSSRAPLRTRDQAALLVRTWNAFFQKKPLRVLKTLRRATTGGIDAEPFPPLVGVVPLRMADK